jgi:preprotein translocase SecA subunit
MLSKIFKAVLGDPHEREVMRLRPIVAEVNALEPEMRALSDAGLQELTRSFQARLGQATSDGQAKLKELQEELDREPDDDERRRLRLEVQELRAALDKDIRAILDEILPRAFAAVREAARRTIGQSHYDEQLMAGIVLHQGKVAEQKTGEGKTLTASLPLYLNALAGRGVHLVTPNDYLSRVGGGWMGPIYHRLGLSVGVIAHDFAGLYDPDYVDAAEHGGDSRLVHWRLCERRDAYRADITYGTNNEFGFDYLRDNMVQSAQQCVQRELYYAIVDEVDNILIDEARTPLIISGEAEEPTEHYKRFAAIVRSFQEDVDYTVEAKERIVILTEEGISKAERALGIDNLYSPEHFELTPYLENALKAKAVFQKDHDYVVSDGQVIIVDEFTGRLMHGRRYSEGLHQAIEAKEGVRVQRESLTVATITFQNYFRMYQRLAGMTGTAETEKEELYSIYGLDVVVLPTHRPMVRLDYPDVIYKTSAAKFRAVVDEIEELHQKGQPVLVGTAAVETSEMLSGMLRKRAIPHNVLNAKLHEKEAFVIAQAGRPGTVTIATNMAGRGVDILLGGNPDGLAAHLLEVRFFESAKSFVRAVLSNDLQGARQLAERTPGLSEASIEEVRRLKAEFDGYHLRSEDGSERPRFIVRKLLEEGQIRQEQSRVARELVRAILDEDWPRVMDFTGDGRNLRDDLAQEVRSLRAVGLGLSEELVGDVKRLRADYEVEGGEIEFVARRLFAHYYNTMIAIIRCVLSDDIEGARELVRQHPELSEDLIAEIQGIMDDWRRNHEHIKQLGGLHIIGTERHEARRIDNQLRGRSGRQGDSGSSRFYVSLEDDLMKRFGGPAVAGIMSRLGVDEDTPIEHDMVSRAIASAQVRVEGFNFDLRKHILEYDDVVNQQRQVIYDQRRLVLSEANLKPIILDILKEELSSTVDAYTAGDEEEWDLKSLHAAVDRLIHLPPSASVASWANMAANQISDQVLELAEAAYDAHEKRVNEEAKDLIQGDVEPMRQLERLIMLRAMDHHWTRHLTALDELREGIGLRAVGQRNPLVEYKREAFDTFEALLANIKRDVANLVLNTRFVAEPRAPRRMRYAGATGGSAGSLRPARSAKVGRNDPCPCGSGKKYKNCCLREGLSPEQAAAKAKRTPEKAPPEGAKRG